MKITLSKLMAMPMAELKSRIESIDAAAVRGRALRRQLNGLKKKSGGFTLLELLVVVAILAAIAGTATIMLQDTDRKASAAAHVAMMDELSKGIQTFRVLNQGMYPDNFDSLLGNGTATLTGATPLTGFLSEDLIGDGTAGSGSIEPTTLTAADVAALDSVGIKNARVVDTTQDPNAGTEGSCATGALIQTMLKSKSTDITAQNIFKDATAGNGCGFAASAPLIADGAAYRWRASGNVRVNAAATDRLIAFGVGPDSTLFAPSTIGALSNVPVYRHVQPTEYNRFIVLWNVSTTGGQASFQAIVDGAGDTKDEELGEFDNVRKT
ncbi:type II secretion system protein [Rhodocyclus tenuis]|uniref:Prepilin-type N-terminal cleavage/methylation domain-containing protein n=1 Tax=Rhodocyclus tenuis TaxID=1066 RepID=A0A840GA24_RHOTE|nr:type II secretion system protein [Rhodocyclus tenuis]MBB4248696.1 prepilin-type N-terminal cleavage/methylation domain-containing protein [Rhodocyclus tenuis]MBK1680869.1 hypothetical protein [Rhodocyclus tenuis]